MNRNTWTGLGGGLGLQLCLFFLSSQSLLLAAESINHSNRAAYPISVEPFLTAGIALGDIDKDGDMDIIIANVTAKNRVFLNDGAGQLTLLAEFGSDESNTYALGIGDINGDGLPDIIAGNSESATFFYYGHVR